MEYIYIMIIRIKSKFTNTDYNINDIFEVEECNEIQYKVLNRSLIKYVFKQDCEIIKKEGYMGNFFELKIDCKDVKLDYSKYYIKFVTKNNSNSIKDMFSKLDLPFNVTTIKRNINKSKYSNILNNLYFLDDLGRFYISTRIDSKYNSLKIFLKSKPSKKEFEKLKKILNDNIKLYRQQVKMDGNSIKVTPVSIY